MAKKEKPTITCTINKQYGFLSDKKDKVFANVTWNDNPPKDEVRKCFTDKQGEFHLASGIALSYEEIEVLYKLCKENHKTPVDFKEIFDSASGINEKRDRGYVTENGFIVLKTRPGVKLRSKN